MANTYTQIHIQFVFAVRFRDAVITPDREERLGRLSSLIFGLNRNYDKVSMAPISIHFDYFCVMCPAKEGRHTPNKTAAWSSFCCQIGDCDFSFLDIFEETDKTDFEVLIDHFFEAGSVQGGASFF